MSKYTFWTLITVHLQIKKQQQRNPLKSNTNQWMAKNTIVFERVQDQCKKCPCRIHVKKKKEWRSIKAKNVSIHRSEWQLSINNYKLMQWHIFGDFQGNIWFFRYEKHQGSHWKDGQDSQENAILEWNSAEME